VGGEINVTDDWPCQCPGCGAALLIDAPINILARWPEILARYGFKAVAMGGGWEKFGLERTVPLDSPDAAACDAVYLGDLITPDIGCPRCHARVSDGVSDASRVKDS
jgi:hypothetical protein